MLRFLLLCLCAVYGLFAVDYDCIFIGSSPIPLLEALYQRQSGKTVLILEQAAECGGAWKSIDICGVAHADLGCHQIGNDRATKEFLEVYAGCKMVSMDHPTDPKASPGDNGFYFSEGCYELMRNLSQLIEAAGIELLLNHQVNSVYVDLAAGHVVVKTEGKEFTAKKIYYTQMTYFTCENGLSDPPKTDSKYPHLYLLVQDPTTPKFSYMNYGAPGASRVMNLTHFVGLENTGRQLFVFQVHEGGSFSNGQQWVDELKQRRLLDTSAYILKEEPYIYEMSYGCHPTIQSKYQNYFERIDASHFNCIANYINRWVTNLKPYREIIR